MITNGCNKKTRGEKYIYIYTTKIIKIYINQNYKYIHIYRILELEYAPNSTTFMPSIKQQTKSS